MNTNYFFKKKYTVKTITYLFVAGIIAIGSVFHIQNKHYIYKHFPSLVSNNNNIIYGSILRTTDNTRRLSQKTDMYFAYADNTQYNLYQRSIPTPITTELPKLANGSSSSHSTSLIQFLENEAYNLGTSLDSDDQSSLHNYLGNRVNQYMQTVMPAQAINQTTNYLNQFGSIKISATVDDDWRLDNFELDYFIPRNKDQLSQSYYQIGARKWYNRKMLNLGMGLRDLSNDKSYMIGINSFLDADLTYAHIRMSVGLEAATRYLQFNYNYYLPVSDWKEQSTNNKDYRLEAKPAKGYDTAITGYLPIYPALSGNIIYTQWTGNYVDINGNLHLKDNNMLLSGAKQSDIDYSMKWEPIPLVAIAYGWKFNTEDNQPDPHINIQFQFNFDQSLSKQMRIKTGETEDMLQNMMQSIAERNNNIVLNYRESKSKPTTFNLDLIKNQLRSIKDDAGILTLAPVTINTAIPIVKTRWIGTGAPYIKNPDIMSATFKPPVFQSNGKNQYYLQLQATEETGKIIYSNKVDINITQGERFNSYIEIFSKKEKDIHSKIDPDSDIYYESSLADPQQQKIYWSLKNNRPNVPSGDYCKNDQNCEVYWENDNGILENTNLKYPTINNKIGRIEPGIYKPILVVKPLYDQSVKITIPIQVLKGQQSSDIKWYYLEKSVESKLCQTYKGQPMLIDSLEAHSIQFKGMGDIKISSQNQKVAQVTETGHIRLVGNGQAMLLAIHHPDNNEFVETTTQISLDTQCNNYNVYWHDDVLLDLKTNSTTKNYVHTMNYNSTLLFVDQPPNLGSIDYSSSNPYVAYTTTSDDTMKVQIIGTGTTYITGTYMFNRQEISYGYRLIVNKGSHPTLQWKSDNELLKDGIVRYSWNSMENNSINVALKTGSPQEGFGTGTAHYYLENQEYQGLVNVDENTGTVHIKNYIDQSLNLKICAYQDSDNLYNKSDSICYKLIATP